ncbi:MAG: hypothetical protein ACYCWW_15990 [Deltaproteobacteria bacterium]
MKPPSPRLRPRWSRYLARGWSVPLACLVGLVLFLRMLLNPVVQKTTLQSLDSLPGYYARLRGVTVSLTHLRYSLDGLRLDRLDERGRAVPFVRLEYLTASIDLDLLLHGTLDADLELERPTVWLTVAPSHGPKPSLAPSPPPIDWQTQLQAIVPFRLQRIAVRDGTAHFTDELRLRRPAQLDLQRIEIVVEDLTNRWQPGHPLPAHAMLSAEVGSSGRLTAEASVAPLQPLPTFDLQAHVDRFNLTDLDRLLAAYSGLTLERGTMDVFIEVTSRNGAMKGEIRPLFRDVKVDAAGVHPSLWKQFTADLLQTGVGILESPGGTTVATTIPLTASAKGPNVGVWSAIGSTLRNAFIEALPRAFPGFTPQRPPSGPPLHG